MLAECTGAVIGVDTHRDTHHAGIAHPSGAVIAACSIPSTSRHHHQGKSPVTHHTHDGQPGRYRPTDKMLAFLESL
jgi:hypothetical protein